MAVKVNFRNMPNFGSNGDYGVCTYKVVIIKKEMNVLTCFPSEWSGISAPVARFPRETSPDKYEAHFRVPLNLYVSTIFFKV